MKTMTILGRKGGIGKTTTAMALAYGLADKGKRVLLIDSDSQANMTESILPDPPSYSLNTLLEEEEPDMEKALIPVKNGISLIASDPKSETLAIINRLEIEEAPQLFKSIVETFDESFDYCIIDTPADMSFCTQAAMVASDSLIIPMLTDKHSINGLEKLLDSIAFIQGSYNPNLEIEGILITKYSEIGNVNREIRQTIEEMGKAAGITVFAKPIHETVKQKEADILGISIFKHSPRNRIVQDYLSLIDELLSGEE